MAKQNVYMRLNKTLLQEAKKILGEEETTYTVETAIRNLINNRRAIELFRKHTGKSKWKGFSKNG